MEKQFFIRTSDEDTVQKLRQCGFKELAKDGSYWVFLNDPDKLQFSSDDDKKKMNFTNRLNF